MYGTYKLPTYRQNSQTRQKGRQILSHPFISMENTARHTQTFLNKFAPVVQIVILLTS